MVFPLAGTLLAATVVQGLSSFALAQTVSETAEKLIAELRRRVQEHIGKLPVSFYDAHKCGALASRVMNDVEGVRNLVGAGSIDFLGGLVTSVLALIILIGISPLLALIAFVALLAYAIGMREAFRFVRPLFRERARVQAEVTGRLTESLGGVRVVNRRR